MENLLKEFTHRRRVALKGDYNDITGRLLGFLVWMESIPLIARLLVKLQKEGRGSKLLDQALFDKNERNNGDSRMYLPHAPHAQSIEEISSVGLALLHECREQDGRQLYQVGPDFDIRGNGYDANVPDDLDASLSRYVIPFLDYIEQRLPSPDMKRQKGDSVMQPPAIIYDSLKKFHSTHKKIGGRGFIMMRFDETKAHTRIEKAIKGTLKKHGLEGMLARDREFHEDLFPNILTYMHGCDFGIAVFERLKSDEFNPNVALENGYMLGLRKQVLLLKDQTLRALQTDLVGKLYREFDPQNPEDTIPIQIERWLTDKGIV